MLRRISYTLLICALAATLTYSQKRIVINEAMYAPIAPEPEWVELYNLDSIAVNLKGWRLSDKITTIKFPTVIIYPKSYILVTKDSTALKAKYHLTDVTIIQGKLPSYNNDGDQIILGDSANITIDSVGYDPKWGGLGGTSIERFDAELNSDSTNFFSSVADSGATPGSANSIRRRDHDIAASRIETIQIKGNTAKLALVIQNRGRFRADTISYKLLRRDQTIPVTLGASTNSVLPFEYDTVYVDWTDAPLGTSSLTLIIDNTDDEFRRNDTVSQEVYLPIPEGVVIINELMIEPVSASCQWVEFYNQSNSIVELAGAPLIVSQTDTSYRFSIDSLMILPKSYGVVAASSKIFSSYSNLRPSEHFFVKNTSTLHLLKDRSAVTIKNRDLSPIDSMYYDMTYYSTNLSSTTGISLERKHSSVSGEQRSNWGSCVDDLGATPLALNSLSLDSAIIHQAMRVSVSPNPFSPDDDHFDDETTITIELPNENEEVVTIKLYDERGRIRRTITQDHRMVKASTISFDGKDDHGIPLQIGLYSFVVQSNSGSFQSTRSGIVIAKRAK